MQLADLPTTYGRFADLSASPLQRLCAQYSDHGELSAFQDRNERFVFAFGPTYNKQILSDPETFHSYFFATRGPKNSAQRRLSSGLLSMNGREHRRHRRMLGEPFKLPSFSSYLQPVSQMIREMLDQWTPGETRDLHDDMTQFMLRVTSSILFGFDQPEVTGRVGEMIHQWVGLSHRAGIAAFDEGQTEHDDYQRLLDLASSLEQEIAALLRMRRDSDQAGNDVLSILLRLHDLEGKLSDGQLIGHTALLFAAAHLTTAHTLTWTLLLLSQHPDVAAELYNEIRNAPDVGRIKINDDPSTSCLERVIRESMRVLPASAYVQRINVEPAELGPYFLPRGTIVVFSQFVTHHMAELFPDPGRFSPARWTTINPSPYAYLPFGAGPRLCIGGPLALMIIKLTIPAILRRFRLQVVPRSNIGAEVVSTMLSPSTSVPMVVYEADGRFGSTPVQGSICDLVDLPAATQYRKPASAW